MRHRIMQTNPKCKKYSSFPFTQNFPDDCQKQRKKSKAQEKIKNFFNLIKQRLKCGRKLNGFFMRYEL